MKLSSRTQAILCVCVFALGIVALYIAMGAALVHLITAAYDQIVADFGNPK